LRHFALAVVVTLAGVTTGACRQVEYAAPSKPQPFPNLKAPFGGTLTIVTRSTTAGTLTETCTAALRIEQQTGAALSGTLTTSGGSGACDFTASVTGETEGSNGDFNQRYRVSLAPSAEVLPPRSCARTDGDGVFRGQTGGNNDMTLTAADAYTCSAPEQTINRTLTLSVRWQLLVAVEAFGWGA